MNLMLLNAILTLQRDDYDKGLDDTKKKTENWADKLQNLLKNKTVNAWLVVIDAVVKLGKQIVDLGVQTMQYADQVGDLASKFGVTTEAISEMQYIASQTGSNVNTLTSSMSMLYMRAKQDGEAFRELGVSVKDNQGNFKAMDELFWETVGAMNSLESEGSKSAYMLDLFGRSATQVGELLRKDSEEIARMRKEAHDLGIVLDQETTDFAGAYFDKIDQVKLQGQSALASLIAGAPDAEERLQKFFDNLMVMLDGYIPAFVNFGVRAILQLSIALIRLAPSLAYELVETVLDVLLDLDMWFQVGVDIGKALVEGSLNAIPRLLNALFGWAGVDIPEIRLGAGENIFEPANINNPEYSVNQNTSHDINVNINASGDSPVSQESAEKTAQALAPYLDRILGGK